MSFEYRPFYSRKLPHLHSPGSTLFLTFRLAGSIPKAVINRWREEKSALAHKPASEKLKLEFRRRWFAELEEILDMGDAGPRWLSEPEIAKIVAEAMKYRDGRVYDLDAFCIMPTHVHSVFTPHLNPNSLFTEQSNGLTVLRSNDPPLNVIMQSLKGFTARKANIALGRSGPFWEEESYDHEVRDATELYRVVKYVLNNPVKAGLVKHWADWDWSYCRRELKPE